MALAKPSFAWDGTKLPYVPGLDGLRGIAIIFILLFHMGLLPGGFISVDIFFVLSGFLITHKFISEYQRDGKIDLMSFMKRRIRRSGPALWLLIVVTLCVSPLTDSPLRQNWKTLGAVIALFNVTNLYWIYASPIPDFFGHTWSLGVEEQFYIVWALAARLLLRYGRPGLVLNVGPDTRADELFAGCAAAAWIKIDHNIDRIRPFIRACRSVPVWLLYIPIFLLAKTFTFSYYFVLTPVIIIVTITIIYASLIDLDGIFGRALSAPWLVGLGAMSYEVYLWHDALNQYLLPSSHDTLPLRIVLAGFGSIVIAMLTRKAMRY